MGVQMAVRQADEMVEATVLMTGASKGAGSDARWAASTGEMLDTLTVVRQAHPRGATLALRKE